MIFSHIHVTTVGTSQSSGPCEGPAHDWEAVHEEDIHTGESVPTGVDVLVAPATALEQRGWDGSDATIDDAVRLWRADGCPAL